MLSRLHYVCEIQQLRTTEQVTWLVFRRPLQATASSPYATGPLSVPSVLNVYL